MVNTTISLGYWGCYLIDFDSNAHPGTIPSPENNHTFFTCNYEPKYLTGKTIGPIVCQILAVLIFITAVIGVIGNIFNLIVLKYSTKGKSLKRLLLALAGFDLLTCIFGPIASLLMVFIVTGKK